MLKQLSIKSDSYRTFKKESHTLLDIICFNMGLHDMQITAHEEQNCDCRSTCFRCSLICTASVPLNIVKWASTVFFLYFLEILKNKFISWKEPQYPLKRELNGPPPPIQSGHFRGEKNFLPLPRLKPWIIQPLA